ncbi:MAG: hypothetical protein JEZ09_15785 [Salinivirgaceae bacterium]|nr:hypothetical protein [Salinivirgaceae bacterium]
MVGTKKYSSLKLKISKLFITKSIQRTIEVCSIDKAQKVGVTFAVRKASDLIIVKKIIKSLADKGLKTFALGYIPEKKPDDFYLSEKSLNFFSDKNLDWLLRPNSASALEFQESNFDILIDLGTEAYYPMDLLIRKSKAKFKVGWYCENSPFDFMINIEKNKGLEYYYTQVIHYLNNLN